jgi:hypothetical protein
MTIQSTGLIYQRNPHQIQKFCLRLRLSELQSGNHDKNLELIIEQAYDKSGTLN